MLNLVLKLSVLHCKLPCGGNKELRIFDVGKKLSDKKRVCVLGVLFFALNLSSLSVLSGCSDAAEEDNVVLLYDDEGVEDVAGNLPAEYADVVSTMTVSCRYRAAVTQDLAFNVERARIDSVLVAAGEEVRKGQLLISLVTDTDIEAERENLLYQIQRLQLLKEKTLHQKEYDITLAKFNSAMDTPLTDEKKKALEETLDAIDDRYYFTLQGYDDDISIATLKLQQLEAGNVDNNIYAGMDGIVEYIRDGLEGSQTVIGRTVITLKDPDDMYFYATDTTFFSYLDEGESVLININGSNGESYEAVPELSDDGTSVRFILTGDDAASASITEGTGGNIVLELGRKEQVLSVPLRAVHKAGDIAYVYVVDDDGYRHYREVQIGLEGDTRIEILSGLEAGDIVAVNF